MSKNTMLPEGIPAILYKYRDWQNTYHKKILTHHEIYFPSPKEFNDPFDCAIPFRYNPAELTEENIFIKARNIAQKAHPDWDETRIQELAYKAQRDGQLFDEHHVEEQDKLRRTHFNQDFGILSLTAKPNNFLMWSHYGNCHRGFVVGFDTQLLFDQAPGHLGPVLYDRNFPTFGLFDEAIEHFVKYAFHKADFWEYEAEYRLLRTASKGRIIKLSPQTVREVILGNNMDFKSKQEVLEVVKKTPHVHVFEAIIHKEKYEVMLQRIM